MKRLANVMVVAGLCAAVGACDGSRGLTGPASANRSAAPGATQGGSTVTTQNIGTMGSGYRNDDPPSTQNIGTIGSGHGAGTGSDSVSVTTQNIGTIGSGH